MGVQMRGVQQHTWTLASQKLCELCLEQSSGFGEILSKLAAHAKTHADRCRHMAAHYACQLKSRQSLQACSMPPRPLRAVTKKTAATQPQNLRFAFLTEIAQATSNSCPSLAQMLGRAALHVADDPAASVARRAAMQLCRGCGMPASPGNTCSVEVVPLSARSRRRAAASACAQPQTPTAGQGSRHTSLNPHTGSTNVVSLMRQCQVCGVRSQQPFSSQAAANTIAQEWQLQRNTQEAQGGQGPSGGGPQSEHHTTCSFDPPAVLPSPRAPSPFLPSLLVPLPAALQSAPPSPITATHIPPSTLAATHIPPAPLLAAPASPLTTPAAVPHSPSAFIPADVHSPPASPIATPHSPLPSSPAVNCSPAQQAALLAQPVPQLPEPPPMVPGPGREMGAEARGVGESLVPGETSADTARAMDEEGTPQPALSGSVTGEAGHVQVLPHTPAPALCSQVVPPATSCQLGCTGPGLSQPKPSPTPIIADRLREGDQHMAPAPQGPPHATSPPTVPPLSEPSVTGPSLAAPNPGAQHERGPSTLLSIRPGKRLEATAAPPLLTSTQQQLSAALTSGSLGWERATLQGAEQGISMVTQHRKPMGEGGEQAGAKGGQTATAQAVASMVRVGCKGRGHSRLGRPKAPSLSQVHHPKIVRLRMRLGALKTTRQALGL